METETKPHQLYCLAWEQHHDNFIKVCQDLLDNETFADVTLIVEGSFFKCHKVILAASSPYFEQVFASLPDDHIMVAFNDDIKRAEMKAILEYVYKGEVNVPRSQLHSVLTAAINLKIKGLTDKDEPLELKPIEKTRETNHMSPPISNNIKKESPTPFSNGLNKSENSSSMYDNSPVLDNIPDWARSTLQLVNNQFLLSEQHQAAMKILPHILKHNMERPLINNNLYSHTSLNNIGTGILGSVLRNGQNGIPQLGNYEDLHYGIPERSQLEKKIPNKSSSSVYPSQLPTDDRKKLRLEQQPTSPTYPRNQDTTYPRNQDTKWKRYKQYSPDALRTAIIEVIFDKESALQSSRRHKVPSRTLYDKVKKVQAIMNANEWNTTEHEAQIVHVIQGNSFSRILEPINGSGSYQNNSNHTQSSPDNQDDEDDNFIPHAIPSTSFASPHLMQQANLLCQSPKPGPSTMYTPPYNHFREIESSHIPFAKQMSDDDDDDSNLVEDLSMKKQPETGVIVSFKSQPLTKIDNFIEDVDDTGQDKLSDNKSIKNENE